MSGPSDLAGAASDPIWLGTLGNTPCWVTAVPKEAPTPPGLSRETMVPMQGTRLPDELLVLMAFPVLAAAMLAAAGDRVFGMHIYDPANGGVILWQHLFWFFGHPEVYIIALPFFGIVSEFPVFSRKPIFGYKTLVYATISIAALSVTVWAHHMTSPARFCCPSSR